ncbi:small capsid protein [Aotine betaherpesvirus 1]|uniref:Small capsomere-interacting protein n=1 Tax=Aotine betaherpesvirus 1 TaxID=50290 RepID=G8XUC4_9BETA|nr:small capsid protein [Aotine betaherpesvirus 1]AEV80754.1 small capsid protein [Aotine betaherpesvirus 1]
MSSGGSGGSGNSSQSKKEKDSEDKKRQHVGMQVLELREDLLNRPVVSTMLARYTKMSSLFADKNAFKLDLLRMLAMAATPRQT